MARFIARIQGNRGQVSRLGSSFSGVDVTANGWNFGVDVHLYINGQGEDEAIIVLTSGSNGRGGEKSIGPFTQKDLEG
jgi:hypothetical protein